MMVGGGGARYAHGMASPFPRLGLFAQRGGPPPYASRSMNSCSSSFMASASIGGTL
jgi:hypothetical protein